MRQPLFSLALHGKLRKLQNKSAASKQELAALVAFADAMNPLPWRSDARPMLSAGEGVKAGDSALVPGSNEDNSKDENQQTERNVIERIDR